MSWGREERLTAKEASPCLVLVPCLWVPPWLSVRAPGPRDAALGARVHPRVYTLPGSAATHLDEVILGVTGAKGPPEEQRQALRGPLGLQQLVILLGVQMNLSLLVTPGVLQSQEGT